MSKHLMSIYAGLKSKAARTYIQLLMLALLFAFLVSCATTPRPGETKGIAVTLSRPGTEDIDLDITYDAVQRQINKVAADAYLQGMNYVGQLQDLQNAQGRIVFLFGKAQRVFLKKKFFWVTASINTKTRTMDIRIEDVTDAYPSKSKEIFIGNRAFRDIADKAYSRINQLGLSDTIVTLDQINGEHWHVTCGPFATLNKSCDFYIVNGELQDTEG